MEILQTFSLNVKMRVLLKNHLSTPKWLMIWGSPPLSDNWHSCIFMELVPYKIMNKGGIFIANMLKISIFSVKIMQLKC